MIQEDPDELGYWIGKKPINPYDALIAALVGRRSGSLAVCEAICPEADDIEEAAAYAHAGMDDQAAICRQYAGYAGM